MVKDTPISLPEHPRFGQLLRTLMVGLLLLSGSVAWGQAVIMNGDYYLTHNEAGTTVNATTTTTFNPATCLWEYARRDYIRTANSSGTAINNNNNYLQNSTTVSLGTDWGDWNRGNNNENIRYNSWGTNYYLRLNGTTWQFSTTNNNNGALYDVDIRPQSATSTNPTINGADVLTAAGNTTYTASGASYRAAYTNYYFRTADHYVDANGNTITPANATLAYAWSLESNDYATVNNSGEVTVSSLPESDLTLTLTVTATATGGTPAAPAGTTLTASKEITIQGTKPSAPIINVSGTNVTLSTEAAGTTSIRYTLDGTDPTATSGTVYSDAIDLSSSTTSPVTIKAVTVRNGNASAVTSETVTLTLPEPTITVNASAGTATITSSISGATIYYTTDGSTPTTSSSQYTGSLSGLAAMTTIKAIAVKDGWNNSPEASEILTIPSGVSGGTVTLFDYEDHTWTYYSGVDASVDGGNYNTNYLGRIYSPNPRNVKITYKANGGAVSIDESETEFIYYKTLEEGTTSGQYPYTVISNPFSKRPNGKGFGGWRIKEGAEYINGYNDEAVLPLDADIVFTNLPYPSVNCTSAEIEFEATWVNLNNITYANNNTITYNVTGGNYETNILVLNRDVTGTITTTSPVTIMMVEPDGSADYRNNTFSGYVNPNNAGVTKIEFAHWTPGNTNVDARGRNFTIGRGMTMDGTRRALYGTAQTSAMNQVLKVESGKFSTFTSYEATPSSITKHWVVFGCDYDRAKNDNSKLDFSGKFLTATNRNLGLSANQDMVRAWSKSGSFLTGLDVANADADNSYYIGITSQHNNGHRYLEIEGGEWYANIAGGMGENHTPTVPGFTFRMKGGIIRGSVYGAAAWAGAGGTRTYVITGGTIRGWVAGGANGTSADEGVLKGATYIYVGGNTKIDSNGSNTVINRAIGGNVFGAGCGYNATSTSGQITLGTNVVVADDAYVERGIYGGGSYGYTTSTSNIYVTGGHVGGKNGGVNGTTYQANITGGVFGGACQNQGGTVNITMTDGLVEGGVYGGSNASGTISGNVTMNINGGQVGISATNANIHGGGYGNSTTVSGNVTMTIGSSTTATDWAKVYGNVYGGSALGTVGGNATITMNKGEINGNLFGGALGNDTYAAQVNGNVAVTVNGGQVTGAVFGCNDANGTPKGTVSVTINGTDPTVVNGGTKTYALQGVYGGGNQAHYNPTTATNGYPKVTVNGCSTSIKEVYGGGNAAAVPQTDVTINGGDIGSVFAGGNGISGTPANVGYQNKEEPTTANSYGNGTATAKIYGGTIGQVFGGSNAHGVIRGDVTVDIDKSKSTADPKCDMIVGEVYGGGNMAVSKAASVSIGCTGTLTDAHNTNPENIGKTLEGIGAVYGGANQADVTSGNIQVDINSGIVANVFGGNNKEGNISGTIKVNIEKTSESNDCSWYVGNVFGGGNLAQYTGSPTVNILNGTVSGNVYGGGAGNLVDGADRGKAGKVTGNPAVTIGDSDANHTAKVLGDVYGGGDAADVAGTPVIVVNDCNTEIGYLYGGGNAADVDGTNITVNGGTIHHDAFGGGHGDKDASSPSKYADVKGDVVFNVYGGTIDRVFAGSNSKGDITGTSALTINKTGTCEMKIREAYGGGNQAAGNAGSVNIGCTGAIVTGDAGHAAHPENIGTTLEGIGAVYGGANAADIGTAQTASNIAVNINSGMVANVYGGNNTSGDIYGTITVNINKNAETCGWYVGNVFGGGNQAVYTAPTGSTNYPAVNILNGEVSGDVFGGGYGNASDPTKGVVNGNPQVTVNGANASVVGGVYGGGSLAPTVGNPVVTLTNGTLTNVYGGGKAAGVTGAPTVNIDGGSVSEGVYGGCNTSGTVDGDITVNINGGTLGTSTTRMTSGIFGGGFGESTATTGNVTVNVGDANAASAAATSTIYGDIYGGSALGTVNDAVADLTTVNINNGTIHGNIYGGGLGAATLNDKGYIASVTTEAIVNGTVHVNIGTATQASNFVTIDGQVFGCNNLAGTPKGNVFVDVYKTAHTAANAYPSTEPTKAIDVTEQASTAFAIAAVYGGGNLAHYTTTTENAATHVTIHGCDNTIEYVYGGGNAASSPATDVVIDGGSFNYIFGGGNGAGDGNPGADIEGNATATISGGLVFRAFGGSNTRGTIGGTSSVDLPTTTTCTRMVREIFGGGNEAPGGNVDMVIPCGTTGTGILYAGANNADMGTQAAFEAGNPVLIKLTVEGGDFTQVFGGNNQGGIIWGNVELYLKGGTIANAFGGNNLGGNIMGTIKVFVVDDENTTCPLVLTNVYGGGYNAAYTPADPSIESPLVYVNHIKSGNKILGNVFGGGYGTPATVTANPVVTIGDMESGHESKIATIAGNVYGGGEQASVVGSTKVIMQKSNSVVEGTIYGAGKGVDNNPEAALVTKNTLVQMTDGQVQRSIYGGGELSSVGTFTETYTATSGNATDADYHVKGEPKTCAANTGLTEVIITGGQVGLVNQKMPDPNQPTSDDDYGYVFCAGKGMADPTQTNSDGVPFANLLAVSGSSHLEISGGLIAASVYGGSENGQVLGNTHVEIKGGQIGSGYYKDGSNVDHWDAAYTEAQWTTAIDKIKASTFTDADAAPFHECDAWPFAADESQRYVYDYFADQYDSKGGSKSAGNGHSFFGNVFGGGSGYYPFAPGEWRRTAGRVCGNTLVEITGGHILTNVYGGNEITDVLGSSKVDMSGGTVGVPRTIADIQARPVNSYIFGAGMGDPRTLFNGWSNVGSAEVIVRDQAFVFGSVFGGGEDGHILGDVTTTIQGDAVIGTWGSSGVDGNIFGSGRGFSAIALTAGVVSGNVTVNIKDNVKILGSVYGGGRLAAVGTYLAAENDAAHYGVLQPGDEHGNVTVNITGGTIGTQAAMSNHEFSVGDVFGGSKGTLLYEWSRNQKLGLVKSTTVNISGSSTLIYGNVYGGGEIASVGSYTYATDTEASTYSNTHTTEPMAEGDVNGVLEENTGKATINITGGTIGQNSLSDTHGSVFGGCLGRAGTGYSGYSFVNNSDVTLNGGTVYGCIFGGGENGHVFHDTDVKILSGTVGIPLDNVADDKLVDNMIYRGNVYGGGRGVDTYEVSNNNQTTYLYSITAGKVSGNTNVTVEGGTIYRNVYGGGSLASVGIRDENTTTDGKATVTIKGGQIGTDGGASANDYQTNIPVRENRRENGFVFGSGRGMSAGLSTTSQLVQLAYTKNTLVNIQGTANVTGSVFGGGENGHVKHNTRVNIMEDCFIGTELTDDEHKIFLDDPASGAKDAIDDNGRGRLLYRGNVYGGGRGIDKAGDYYSLTAGRVYGDTYVEISGGKIYHDVFGGGSLASVGTETVENGEVVYNDQSGETEVHIKGGIIGYSDTNPDKQGFNCGFVYGGCRGLSAPSNSDIVKMAYVHNTKVYIEPGADVKGSVFGGGANGHVKNDTYVEISGGSIGTALLADEVGFDDYGVAVKPVFRGNVYAGGRGVDQYYLSGTSTDEARYSLSAGAVYGNATLLMTGGHVWHNIYGSGAMASVGTVQAKPAGAHVHDEVVDNSGTLVNDVVYNPDESEINYLTGVFKEGTGTVTVTITGGIVGDTTEGHEGRNNGRVYGAGRGVSAARSDYIASMEYVNKTYVTIGTEGQTSYTAGEKAPYIYGAVFGGGENGHVKTDTDVKIHSGIVGFPLVEGDGQKYKTAADGATKNPYRGHVFGGGRGVDPVHHGTAEQRSSSAGRVYGHTKVTMTGGVVRRAIYGGGLLASVGVYRLNKDDSMHITDVIEDEVNAGNASITISGGYIGNVNPDGSALTGAGYLAPGDNNGFVFGSSCGMVADDYTVGQELVDIQYRQMGYAHSTNVNISGDNTRIFGCVFGSGENGHVWYDAVINISGGQIGSEDNTSIYTGNVYGSGRGVDHPHAQISETAGKVRGNTTVNITGGTVWRDVYGGGSLASVGEADEVAVDSKKHDDDSDLTLYNPFPYSSGLTRVIIDGESKVHGSVYGSGRGVASVDEAYKQAAYVKNTLVTVKGNAHVYNNVFGGGNAGHVRKNTDVTIDGSAKVDGNVYGGGKGSIESPTAGLVNHDVAVNIKGGLIAGDVYGGGAIGNTNVHDKRNTGTYGKPSEDVFAKTEVNLLGGIVLGDAYGGGQGVIPGAGATDAEIANAGALVRGDVTVTLNGTAFYPTTINDNSTPAKAVPASGRVFGCNNLNGTPQGTVLVHVLQTKGVTKEGDNYTVNNTKPDKGNNTYEVEAVYGGGNLAAYEPWDPAAATGQYSTDVVAASNPLQVVIDGCELTSIDYVYGGGNAASVPSSQVTVLGTYEIGTVFGGGNGKDKYTLDGGTTWNNNLGAHVGYKADGTTPYGTGNANVYLFGGTIHNAFGASNTLGNIAGKAEVHVAEKKNGSTPICPLVLDELYGGGNEAYMEGGTNIDLGCVTYLKTIYGGAKNANVNGDINLTITSGHFDRVFGGNNIGGTISGSITVNIEETGCNPITIGELYGCGNQAPFGDESNPKTPTINVKSFTSIGRIFGGGLGETAVVTGNPTVNINEIVGDGADNMDWTYHQTTKTEGGETVPDAGKTITFSDGTSVVMPTHEKGKMGAIGTVFGGGNAAEVKGNTNVNIGTLETINYTSDAAGATGKPVLGADIRNNVFGGGNQAKVTGNTNVVVGK